MPQGQTNRNVVKPRGDGRKRDAILRKLGRAADERALFSLPSPLLPWIGLVLGVALLFLLRAAPAGGPVAIISGAAVTLAYLVVLLYPRKLVVGEDGLLLVWIFSRFVPYRDIAYIEGFDGFYFTNPCINVALRSGSALSFATSLFKERFAERDALLQLLRTAIDEAATRRPVRAPALLLRGGKDTTAWVLSLRSIGAGANVDLRTPAVPIESLLRVAESPAAPLVERAAAYVALTGSTNEDVKKRLRVAADLSAAPLTKDALRAVLEASEDDSALATLLELVEAKTGR